MFTNALQNFGGSIRKLHDLTNVWNKTSCRSLSNCVPINVQQCLRSVKFGIEVFTLAFRLEMKMIVEKGSYTLREIYVMFYTFFSKHLKYPIDLKKADSLALVNTVNASTKRTSLI